MPVDFFIKATNELAALEFDVTNEDGTAVDLTGATVIYRIWSTTPGTETELGLTPTITAPVSPSTNRVRVQWTTPDGDLDTPGRYYGVGDILFPSGRHLTVPTVGYHQLFADWAGPVA